MRCCKWRRFSEWRCWCFWRCWRATVALLPGSGLEYRSKGEVKFSLGPGAALGWMPQHVALGSMQRSGAHSGTGTLAINHSSFVATLH